MWSANYINDPNNDFDVVLELLYDKKIVGIIKQEQQGLKLKWYAHDKDFSITIDSLLEILNEAKKKLVVQDEESYASKGDTMDDSKNTQQGMNYLKKILNDPHASFNISKSAVYGEILDVVLPDGMGARWTSDGETFIGLLESSKWKGI